MEPIVFRDSPLAVYLEGILFMVIPPEALADFAQR